MKPVTTIGYLLQHVAVTLQRQSDQVLQERLGIGMSQYRILMMLQALPETNQRKLADRLGQTEASISRQVKLLHEKGFLATRIDPAERRRHLTTPTLKGLKITEAAREILNNYHAPMLANLGDKQQQQLKEMLSTLHEYTCAPGRPMACDHPFDIAEIYEAVKEQL
jgi:DNA-binding MarR family transcriptional regulator